MQQQINLKINSNVFLPTFLKYAEDYSNRYEVYYGGRGSGKTKFIVQKLLIKGLKEKRLIVLMRKETNKIKDSIWKELTTTIEEFKLTPYFTFNRSEFRAVCTINGTEFKCLGLDEPEKIKGFADASDVYMDELTGFTKEDYELIDGTIRSKKYKLPLQVIGSFNPVSKVNWVYKYFQFDTDTIPPNTLIHKSTYMDNPRLDESYYRRMEELKERSPIRYKIEALGLFTSTDRLVYNNWHIEEFDYKELTGELCIGLDFGFINDPTALIASIVDVDNKKWYVFDEAYQKGLTNDRIAKLIENHGYSKSVIIADSAEQKSIEEIKKHGIYRIRPSTKGKDSINMGIQYLQQYDLIINPSCVNIIEELENYSYTKDKTTGEYTNQPIDMYNHLLDALRYSAQVIWKPNKLRVSGVRL